MLASFRAPDIIDRMIFRDVVAAAEDVYLTIQHRRLMVRSRKPTGIVSRSRPGLAVCRTPHVSRTSLERIEPAAEEPQLILVDEFPLRISRLPTRLVYDVGPVVNFVFHHSDLSQPQHTDKRGHQNFHELPLRVFDRLEFAPSFHTTESDVDRATTNPTQSGAEMGETKAIVRPAGNPEMQKPRDFAGFRSGSSRCNRYELPDQGVNYDPNSRGKVVIGEEGDALSDAPFADRRLVALVEAWAGLPDGLKDRISELVAGAVKGELRTVGLKGDESLRVG